MKTEKELYINKAKSDSRILIGVTLLGICFTLFTFITALKPELFSDNIFLSLQLSCSIPFLIFSLFARSKLSYTHGEDAKKWDFFGFGAFLLGYTFLLNVVGILLITFISVVAGLAFFSVNIATALLYSAIQVSCDKKKLKSRIIKDLCYILILLLLGILPSI